ncbi:MAG TPA: hypothetical protein VLC50_03695 [Actinomycetes bacterium]|nr:hypothetical protein [Actinomycetes bacterium]
MRLLRRVLTGLVIGAGVGYVVELLRPRRHRVAGDGGGPRGF